MLDRWCEQSIKHNDIPTACVLHAHLAFLFFHLPEPEFTRPIVATVLSSQIFLTTRYRYDLAAEVKGKVLRFLLSLCVPTRDRQTDRQRQTERQRDRQTDRTPCVM